MKIRTILLFIVLAAFAVFAALNWSAFIKPTTLSLGFSVVEAPLGLVLLGFLAFLVAFFLIFVVYLETATLFDMRRHSREVQVNRDLADQAEASRFTELRVFLESELKNQNDTAAERHTALFSRLDKLEVDLRFTVEEAGNTVTAYIGELDHRIETAGCIQGGESTA